MKKQLYKVLVIGLLLKNNSMANAGEEIEGNKFATPVDQLVAGGYVSKVKKSKKAKAKEQGEEEMIEIEVNQETLDENPEFVKEGIKVGDKIQIPANSLQDPAEEEEELELEEGESQFDYMLKADLIKYAEDQKIDISAYKTADEIRDFLKSQESK